MNIDIKINGAEISVASPYNSEFVEQARNLGGKWSGGRWVFDVRDEDRVRDLCREVYGDDGRGPVDQVTLRVEWPNGYSEYTAGITVSGRPIARAFGRDSGARLDDGVVVLAGGFDSGGSRKNWRTEARAGTAVLVRDFPRAVAEQLITGMDGMDDDDSADSGQVLYAIEDEPEDGQAGDDSLDINKSAYTVILLYPDFMTGDHGADIYTGVAEGVDGYEAAARVQQMAVDDNSGHDFDRDDLAPDHFRVIAVIQGDHEIELSAADF